MHSRFYLSAALVLGVASSLPAQTTITPFIGAMVPMQSLLIDTAGSAYFRMESHSIYGVAITKTMSPRLGLTLAGGGGSGKFEVLSTGTPFSLRTSVWFADLRARLRVAGNDDVDLAAVVGAGWTQFSTGLFEAANEADPDTEFKGTVTGIVGLGLRAKMSEHLTLSASLLDRIHEQGIDAPAIGDGFKDPLQHDLTFSAGLVFPLGR